MYRSIAIYKNVFLEDVEFDGIKRAKGQILYKLRKKYY